MDDLLTPSTSVSSTSTEPDEPLLPCARFLQIHFQHGGVNERDREMLHRMIQIMTAIGVEAGRLYDVIELRPLLKNSIEAFGKCVQQGVDHFFRKSVHAFDKAQETEAALPDLRPDGEVLEANVKQWRWRLRLLHEPTGNDSKLFTLMAKHFKFAAVDRVVKLRQYVPHENISYLVEQMKTIHAAFGDLIAMADAADEWVDFLDGKLWRAEMELKCLRTARDIEAAQLLQPSVYRVPEGGVHTRLNPALSKSFGAAEEELVRRSNVRAASEASAYRSPSEANLNMYSSSVGPSGVQTRPRGRARGAGVPRVFTGSFSQLESEIRRYHIDKVETPTDSSIDSKSPVREHGFATTSAKRSGQQMSPALSPSLSGLFECEDVLPDRKEPDLATIREYDTDEATEEEEWISLREALWMK